MANIIMCDFCGEISGGAAASIAIRINDPVTTYARLTDNERYISHVQDAYVKDACKACLAKFLETPRISIGGHPFKEDVPASD